MRRLFKDALRSNVAVGLFSGWQRYRRWYGGVWELWWVEAGVNSLVWHDVTKPTKTYNERPGPVRGRYAVEDYRGVK